MSLRSTFTILNHACVILTTLLLISTTSAQDPLFEEDFESIELGESVDEGNFAEEVWSDTPPTGWEVDSTDVAGIDEEGIGMTEWKGWNFANAEWWTTVDDQRRSEFIEANGGRARGTVAIADPDEWDDLGSPGGLGTFNSFLISPEIPLAGLAAASVTLAFDSSWRPEDTQRAVLDVSYDGAAAVRLIDWVSTQDNKTNERIVIKLDNPVANSMRLTWGMIEATNDWWWAIDNILVTTEALPICPSKLKAKADTEAKTITLTWTPGANIPGAQIEILRDAQVLETVPFDRATFVDNPPVDAGGNLKFDYELRVTGENHECQPLTKKVVYSVGGTEKIAQWDFNEGGGIFTENSVGGEWQGHWNPDNAFPAEPGGGDDPEWVDAENFGGAVAIEGLGYFDLGDFDATTGLQPEIGVSVAAWVKTTDFTNWAGIYNMAFDSGSSESGFYLGTRDGVDYHFALATDQSPSLLYLRAPGEPDVWQYVVGTFDGETLALYIDGEEANSADYPGAILYESVAGAFPLGAQIGVFLDDNEYFPFGGSIAHVAVWNGGLTADEVKDLYEKGLAGNFGEPTVDFQITDIQIDSERNEVTLTWPSRSNKTYSLESSSTLENWIEVDDGIESAGETTSTTTEVEAGTEVIYFRVIEQ